jgi:hypothetical protein
MEPKHLGKSINMTLSPLPAGKRKRRFLDENEAQPPAAAEEQTEQPA